jgi:hypothetical protein
MKEKEKKPTCGPRDLFSSGSYPVVVVAAPKKFVSKKKERKKLTCGLRDVTHLLDLFFVWFIITLWWLCGGQLSSRHPVVAKVGVAWAHLDITMAVTVGRGSKLRVVVLALWLRFACTAWQLSSPPSLTYGYVM